MVPLSAVPATEPMATGLLFAPVPETVRFCQLAAAGSNARDLVVKAAVGLPRKVVDAYH